MIILYWIDSKPHWSVVVALLDTDSDFPILYLKNNSLTHDFSTIPELIISWTILISNILVNNLI